MSRFHASKEENTGKRIVRRHGKNGFAVEPAPRVASLRPPPRMIHAEYR